MFITFRRVLLLQFMQLHYKMSQCMRFQTMWYVRPAKAQTGPRSAVGNVSGYRCVTDCNSRGLKFDPGPVPYFR